MRVDREEKTADAEVEGGRINFILRARSRLGSLNTNCSVKMRQGVGTAVEYRHFFK
jgi:hypothetical protein